MNERNRNYENKHEGTARALRIIGLILMVIGLPTLIIGIVDFAQCFETCETPTKFFCMPLGAFTFIGGLGCLLFGSQRKIAEFNASQAAPVTRDFTNYFVDETSDSVANAAGKVFGQINQNMSGVNGNKCEKCGTINPAESFYCANCGSKIVIQCECGTVNDDGARFCNGCGKRLR